MKGNKLFASCGLDVKIHGFPSGEVLYTLPPPNGCNKDSPFKCISWSASGNILQTISPNGKPIIIRKVIEPKDVLFSAECVEISQTVETGIFSKISEDSLAFGTLDGEVYVVNIANSVFRTYITLPASVILLDYTPRDTFLAAGCTNGHIYLYNITGDVCASFCIPKNENLSAMIFHPTRESYIVAAGTKGTVTIWDIQSNTVKFVAKRHKVCVTGLAISATEELLATVGHDGACYVYDLRTRVMLYHMVYHNELSCITCSCTNEVFAIGTVNGSIFFFERGQTKGSINGRKQTIRSLRFQNEAKDRRNPKLMQSMSEQILADEESTVTTIQTTNIDSDLKTQASGDFAFIDAKTDISRIPGGMDDGLESNNNNNNNNNNNTEKWIEQLPEHCGDKDMAAMGIMDEHDLFLMKQDIIEASKDIVQKFMEEINAQFLKIRMGVSREFCRIEQSNNKRWHDFNAALQRLAGCEEPRRESGNVLSDSFTNESVLSKQESLYCAAKTKVTDYTLPADSKLH